MFSKQSFFLKQKELRDFTPGSHNIASRLPSATSHHFDWSWFEPRNLHHCQVGKTLQFPSV